MTTVDRSEVAGSATASALRLEAWVLDALERSQKWNSWAALDERIAAFNDLAEAREAWENGSDFRTFGVIAGLIKLACRRGSDDELAALVVLVLLAPGIQSLAVRLEDLCEADEVRSAVWEAVKAAEPHAGRVAARHILQRAHQKLVERSRRRPDLEMSTEVLDSIQERACLVDVVSSACGQPDVVFDGAARELVDVLRWSRSVGVVDDADIRLLLELQAGACDGTPMKEIQARLGRQDGVTPRSIRRRRNAILARLREAAPAYLAATA